MRELLVAGGGVAIVATMQGCPNCCNANPDPCCSAPKSETCAEWNACAASDAGSFEACYYHFDLAAPDLKPPADLVTVPDVGGARD